jgi:transposase-like protein
MAAKKKKKASKRKATKKKAPRRKNPNMRREPNDLGGRLSLLTPETQAKICEYLSYGNFIETAAAAVGIDQSTLRRWLKRGRREMQRLQLEPHTEPDPKELIYLDFCKAVDKAEAQAEIDGLKMLEAHGYDDWRSIAWRLERKSFSRWGRRQAIEHSGPEGRPMQVQRLRIGKKVIEF